MSKSPDSTKYYFLSKLLLLLNFYAEKKKSIWMFPLGTACNRGHIHSKNMFMHGRVYSFCMIYPLICTLWRKFSRTNLLSDLLSVWLIYKWFVVDITIILFMNSLIFLLMSSRGHHLPIIQTPLSNLVFLSEHVQFYSDAADICNKLPDLSINNKAQPWLWK